MSQKPKSIIDEEWAARWDVIFGRDLKEESKAGLTDQALIAYNKQSALTQPDALTNQTESSK
jgi:hypothetical protein